MSPLRRWLGVHDGTPGAFWRLLGYAVAVYGGIMVASVVLDPIVGALYALAGLRVISYPWAWLVGALIGHAIALRGIEKRDWASIGLGRAQLAARPLLIGAALGAAAVGLPALLLAGAGQLRAETQPWGASPAGAWLGAAASVLVSLAPAALFEELLVRGYPFAVLRENAGPVVALVVTSLVFGAMHLQNPGATPLSVALVTLAGIFLGAVLLVTGSLWAAWLAHLAWNWTMAGLLHVAVSGLPFATPGYRLVDAGPDWLTGGTWGPEGGAGAGLGMLAGLSYLWFHGRRARSTRDALTLTSESRPNGRGSA